MKPGLHIESVPCDLAGKPVMEVCAALEALYAGDAGIAGGVGLAVTPTSPRHLWVSMLQAFPAGLGLGGRALDALCGLCDRHGVVIELACVPVGGRGLAADALLAFYARCGFAVDERGREGAMVREPSRTGLPRAA